MGWFYYIGKDRLGPVDDLGLRRLAANRYITPETIIENEQGQSARAGQIRGLEFPAPDANPQPFAPTGASTGAMPNAAPFPAAPHTASGQAGASVPEPGGAEATGTTEASVTGTSSQGNFSTLSACLDFDLSRIVGDPGTQVNVNLLRNFANICKVYFWIFSIVYWVAYIPFVAALQNSPVGAWGGFFIGLLIGFPLYFIGYFFFRIVIKYGIEVTKLLIRLNQFLEDEEARKAP